MSDEDHAVDKLAGVIKMVIRVWPIYGIVLSLMWGYGELYMDAKIAAAIKKQALELPVIVQVTGDVVANKEDITEAKQDRRRIENKVEEVEGDTKAILRHLAGENDG